jgi:hypothetical protein
MLAAAPVVEGSNPGRGKEINLGVKAAPQCGKSARPDAGPKILKEVAHPNRYGNSAIACELGLPEDIVNVEGGAIAHGHPIGATGAVLTTRLIHSMRRDGLERGIVTLCIGGGQGIALALEIRS